MSLNKISHIYFKGSVISKLYDDPYVRTRGDIDVYISPKEIEKTKMILSDNAYFSDAKLCDNTYHYGFIKS